MTKKASTPALRFKGFTYTWEQRKLSEFADKVTEKNVGLQYIETFTNSAEFGIISQRDFFDHDIAKMSSLGGYYIVRSEDFVYNPRISTSAPVGPINRNKLGRIGVMSPLYTVFRPHDIGTTYLEHFFKSKYWHSFMNFNGDSGARSDRFSIKDSVFFEMPIPIPHIEEQRKIGEYLTHLDRLITLHQRKYDKLTNMKKSMLEKMFPKNGANVPEIRFKGFTDAWEQRKLKELATFAKGTGYSKSDLTEQGTPIILYGRLYTKYETKINDVDTFAIAKKSSVYSTGNEVIVPASGETAEDIARASYVAKSGFLLGGDLNIIYPIDRIEPTFLALSISNGEQQKSLAQKAQGKSVVHIHNSDLESIKISYPKMEEQEKIGRYFLNLDRLITLHQRELEKLKNLKKACLEKMFV
ncbi:restriction endonuclease subunit S [Porcipelethomonas ammoniilytica]|uniref:restriction endonuclease subunit S n=1 Tax=Porcipelethomonas ammoniilytica TaxID=2981722 RepID=UPI000822D3B0|nr:restriction endonuclease subunit S [Porcipelethomonas ammoniilytica]MCU6719445.1 restriction endonuclease subunit S [Porcipelethomonas ammoniilytica]SCI80880.1 EcoKI restriction-modification system protein HsdS [uncultured Ruminococcus sp.]